MPQLRLTVKYRVNDRNVISPAELLDTYFFGIRQTVTDGQRLTDDVIRFYIASAQQEVEDALDIRLIPQVVQERRDFMRADWLQWGIVRTRFPVNKAILLEGFVNTVRQIKYPPEWLSTKYGSDGQYWRQIHLVPNGSTSEFQSSAVIYTGITPHLGFLNNANIPNYWDIKYCTGFEYMPRDIINVIGKLGSISIFHLLGDVILGAGIASQSIGLDGLSQSISTTSSATNAGYGSRIIGYIKDIDRTMPYLKSKYKGLTIMAM